MFGGMLDDIGQGVLNAGQSVNNAARQDPNAFLAAAAGYAPKTGMGGMAGSLYEHFTLQDKMKEQEKNRLFDNERKMKAEELAQAKLDEAKRFNSAKITDYAAKAAKYGKPTKLNSYGGMTTMLGADGVPFTIEDEHVGALFQQAEQLKVEIAKLNAGEKAQGALTAPPAVKLAAEQDTQLKEAKVYMDQFKDLQAGMEKTGGISMMSRMLPNGISAMGNRIIGTQDGKLQAGVASLNMKNFVKLVSGFPGSLSNAEGTKIEAALPKVDDDPALWKTFFDTYGPMLEADYKNMQTKIATRDAESAQTKAQPSFSNGGAATIQTYPGKAGAKVAAKAAPAREGFVTPNNGMSPATERVAIISQELADEQKQPDSPRKAANIAALQRELKGLGAGAPEAAAPAAPTRKPLTAFQK